MGKTYRYSPEADFEGHPQDHRIPSDIIAEAHRLEAKTLHRHMPRARIPLPSAVLGDIEYPRVLPGWVPSRADHRTPREMMMREERLSLIEQIGHDVLQLAAETF